MIVRIGWGMAGLLTVIVGVRAVATLAGTDAGLAVSTAGAFLMALLYCADIAARGDS